MTEAFEGSSGVEGWVRDSGRDVCETGTPVLEVRIGVDVDGGTVFEEVLAKVFNTAALKESFASPDRISSAS